MKLEDLSTERLREEKRKIEAELSKRHKTYEDENIDCKWLRDNVKQKLLNSLAEESTMVISTAYAYAKNYVMYGEDITKAWTTAAQQASIIQKVRQEAWVEAYDSFKKDYENHSKADKEKPKSCSTCRSYKGHAGHCEICHEMSMYKEEKDE